MDDHLATHDSVAADDDPAAVGHRDPGRPGTPRDPALLEPRPRGTRIGLTVAGVLVVVDQVVKLVVERVLEPGEFVPWLSDSIGWQLVYNDAGAFGLPLPSWVFLVVAALVVALVVRNLPQVGRAVPAVAYGMLVAGALGNVIDRVVRTGDAGDPRWLHGHVVDFVAWGAFPRFNVADAAITIGFLLLVVDVWRHGDEAALPGVDPPPPG